MAAAQNYEAGLAVGGPIIDGVLGFRFSVSYRQDGGWVDRVNYTAPPSTTITPPPLGSIYGPITLYTGPPTYTGTDRDRTPTGMTPRPAASRSSGRHGRF